MALPAQRTHHENVIVRKTVTCNRLQGISEGLRFRRVDVSVLPLTKVNVKVSVK